MHKMRLLRFLGSLRFLIFFHVTYAQVCEFPTNNEGLASILQDVRQMYHLPSIAGAIVSNFSISMAAVGTRIYGDDQTNVTLCDAYHIGSDTKAFTSLLVGMLVDEEKLQWNTTLKDVFSDSEIYVVPAYQSITIEQLLSHTSGLPSDENNLHLDRVVNNSYFQPGNLNDLRVYIIKEGMMTISVTPKDPPQFAYSNFGYMIIGAVLEHLTGTTWEQLITDRIFRPLKFRHAGLGCQLSFGEIDAPAPHKWDNATATMRHWLAGPNCDNPAVYGPAGTAHMSIIDFAVWAGFQLHRGEIDVDPPIEIPPLVSPEVIDYLHKEVVKMEIENPAPGTPPSGGYAKGWGIVTTPFSTRPLLFHGGSNEKNLAYIWLDMEGSFAMVLTTNMGGHEADAALNEATRRMWEWGHATQN